MSRPVDGGRFAVRTWAQVAKEFRKRTGERLTPARVMQLCRQAERKIAAAVSA